MQRKALRVSKHKRNLKELVGKDFVRTSSSLAIFKKQLKTFLFKKAFDLWK